MFVPQSETKTETTETKFGMSKVQNNNHKYPYETCKLYDCGGDVSKQWIVEYYVYNNETRNLLNLSSINPENPKKKRRKYNADYKAEVRTCLHCAHRLQSSPTHSMAT